MSRPTPSYSPLMRVLLGCYASVKRAGVLELPAAKRAFLESYFLYKRYLEDPFFKFARRYPELFAEGAVLDVGANCGYTAMVFAQTKASKVYAFEPDAENVAMLQKILASRNLLSRVEVVASAVGAEDGFVDLWRNEGHHADHRIATSAFKGSGDNTPAQTVQVPLVSLDSFVSKKVSSDISFVKIDVQGFELPVCHGMNGILTRFPNITCALEYCPAQIEELGFSPHDILDFFQMRGFKLFILERNGTTSPLAEDTLSSAVERRGYADLLATRRDLPV
jgi:FkbM family methyltransferase